MEKICSRCKIQKPTTDFYRGGGADGFQAWCRDCMKGYQRKIKEKDEERDENALYVLSYESCLKGPYKIGRTNCVEQRVMQLEASQCFRIVVHAAFPQMGGLEKRVHERLAPYQVQGVRGKEWFHCPLATILTVIAGYVENPEA
jgi:hypothetical protein